MKSFAVAGTRLLQHNNSNLHYHQQHQEPKAPVAAALRHSTHVQHSALLQQHTQLQQKHQTPATASVAACYAAAMPASLSSTWSYDADDEPTACGMNGGGLNRINQLFVSSDNGSSAGSICNSDEYESFGSSDSASLPSSDASSCTGSHLSTDSYSLDQQLHTSSSSSSSAAFWLSPSALQELEESWGQQGSSFCMAGHECR